MGGCGVWTACVRLGGGLDVRLTMLLSRNLVLLLRVPHAALATVGGCDGGVARPAPRAPKKISQFSCLHHPSSQKESQNHRHTEREAAPGGRHTAQGSGHSAAAHTPPRRPSCHTFTVSVAAAPPPRVIAARPPPPPPFCSAIQCKIVAARRILTAVQCSVSVCATVRAPSA